MSPHSVLKKYYGYDNFRPLQEEIIQSILDKKDTLALLPTGGGKSICFQIPALMADGICLVISPLIALIKDQVENLQKKGIPALAIYSGMSFIDVKQTLKNAAFGNYKFLYISPERLQTSLFLEYLPAIKPSLIAVDEAHCISQWGYDFRPSYKQIADIRKELPNVPIIALTASATVLVQNDICDSLLFGKKSNRFQQSFLRPNLSYSAFKPSSKETKLLEILQNVKGSAIVYCKSRRQTTKVAELLQINKLSSDYYHAGLSSAQRTQKQDDWIKNKLRIIVCTNAFGMGIDKPDVRVVVHFDVPDSIENYYQEAGRAGRDGKRAYAVLLYSSKETDNILYAIETKYPSTEKLIILYKAIMNYLQIAAGIGEGQSFDFDIAIFSQQFKINILEATYGLQALAQEGLLTYTELIFKQSTVVFCVNKNDLNDFQIAAPWSVDIIKGLLRSYEGIFDYPANISETVLAKFIHDSADNVIKNLKLLHQSKIIVYTSSSEKPQLLLLKNRMYNDDIKISQNNISIRKAEAQKRALGISDFVHSKTICRSKYIANYFGDATTRACGICDNCINNTTATLQPADFKKCADGILELLANNELTTNEVISKMKPFRQRSVWLVIEYLLSEEKIVNSKNNRLGLNNSHKKDTYTEI